MQFSLLPVLLALSASLTSAEQSFKFSIGTYKMDPPLPAEYKTVTVSPITSSHIVIGPETIGTPYSFTPFPRGAVTSFYYPSASMYLESISPAGLYDLRWRNSGAATDKFSASGCGCGAHCGGPCVVVDNVAPGGEEGPSEGQWVVSTGPKDDTVGGWKVQFWKGAGAPPQGLQSVLMWRAPWSPDFK